ncbi:hypothetical protein SedNR2807_35870 [Citrobacter sedlakii]
MDYPQILAPILRFLHCPTPQAWIDQARLPQHLPLLLTDHLLCELKAAQTAMLLVRKYVADKQGAQALLAWLQPYEAFAFRDGPEPDFVALNKHIGKSVMPKTDDPWGQRLIDSMVLLKRRAASFLAGAGSDAGAQYSLCENHRQPLRQRDAERSAHA